MKYLRQFEKFDWHEFSKDKRFLLVGLSPLTDRQTNEVVGSRGEVVIIGDETDYDRKGNDKSSNLYEKLYVKVPKQIDMPMQVEVQLKNALAVVYGDYRNQLSVYAEDIIVVKQ